MRDNKPTHNEHPIPDYLKETYFWAYLNPKNIHKLDRKWVVNILLFGNAERLFKAYVDEIPTGVKMLQIAHVYGDLMQKIAAKIGENGKLDIIDIAPQQLAQAAKKVEDLPQVSLWQQDAKIPYSTAYDLIGSFFLLHEVPMSVKRKIMKNILENILKSGGRAVFVDYHRPCNWQPVKPILLLVNRYLEPFADEIWRHDLQMLAPPTLAAQFRWEKATYFGGVYQKVVVTPR